MFGQTVTASGDTMGQYRNRMFANPKKWVCMDIECDAGCGVVPFKYRDQSFVNALQWAIGLELFLLVDDPWRIFLTTDHPNGAPFTFYPHLIRLLMDKTFRNEMLGSINKDAAALTFAGLARLANIRSTTSPSDPRRTGENSRPSRPRPSWGRGRRRHHRLYRA